MLILSLSLIHGLVTSTLLVECIQADGELLMEFLGQDPCHRPFVDSEAHDHGDSRLFSQVEDDRTDPCVDLSLDSFGVSARAVEASAPCASAIAAQNEVPVPAPLFALPADCGRSLQHARDALIDSDLVPVPLSSLRI